MKPPACSPCFVLQAVRWIVTAAADFFVDPHQPIEAKHGQQPPCGK
jgi:hypothetical protein